MSSTLAHPGTSPSALRTDGSGPVVNAAHQVAAAEPGRDSELSQQRFVALLAALASLAALIRAPMALTLPPGNDEAGFVVVARAWHRGAKLYSDEAWVDRPQGLLLVYRGLVALGWDTPVPVRMVGLLCGALVTIGVGLAARSIGATRSTALLSATVWATVGAAPGLDGYSPNGELLAAVPTIFAIALAARACGPFLSDASADAGTRPRGLSSCLVGAGALAAIAVLMKQSGVDAAVVCVALVLSGRARISSLIQLIAGALIIVVPTVVHAASIGLDRYWFSVVSVRSHTYQFGFDVWIERAFRVVFVPGALLVAVALCLPYMRAGRRIGSIMAIWLLCCAVTLLIGSFFWPHYFVQPLVPLCVGSGWALRRAARREMSTGLVATLTVAASLLVATGWKTTALADGIPRPTAALSAAVRARVPAGTPVLGLPGGAVAFLSHRPPADRYLWDLWYQLDMDHADMLRQRLASGQGPDWVAEVTSTEGFFDVLRSAYLVDTQGEGYRLWRRRDIVSSPR